jgi:hypothetical protein
MKRAVLLFGMLLMAAPAHADLTHKISSSVQLSVDAAATNVQRIGNSYSVSGSGVTLDVGGGSKVSADLSVGGLGTITTGAAAGSLPTAYQTVDGNAFSYSNSFTAGDSIVTTAPTVGAVSAYSNQTSTAAGTGTPAGTISSAGVVTLTAAGSGTSATGQFVTEITIK